MNNLSSYCTKKELLTKIYLYSAEYTEDVKPEVPKVKKQVLLQYKSGEVKPKPRIHKCPAATCDKMFSKPSYAKHHHDTVR